MELRVSLCSLLLLAVLAGCSRRHYRLRADADSHRILAEKTHATPWMPPGDFAILPRPDSRLYFPSNLDDPLLPMPAPQLYAYELPKLTPRAIFSPKGGGEASRAGL